MKQGKYIQIHTLQMMIHYQDENSLHSVENLADCRLKLVFFQNLFKC